MATLQFERPRGAGDRVRAIRPGASIRLSVAALVGGLQAVAHPVHVALVGLAGGVVLTVWATFSAMTGIPVDAWCYYFINPAAPYWKTAYAFLYSPAAAQAMVPLQLLSFEAFVALLRGAELLAVFALAGPLVPLVVFWSPLASEINAANINILIVAVAVWGLRWPWLWSFVLLTKVAPGVGLLWFVARREWRHLGVALGVTAVISIMSFALAPGSWFEWVAYMTTLAPSDGVPLWVRLGMAAAIVVWGALTDRPWTVVLAVTIATPRLYLQTPAMLVGLLYYVRPWFSDLGRLTLASLRAVARP
ncbi:MAG: glycosyltransferase family 87 protein [Candidatus Limnocylindrales bacterium]